MWRMCARKWAKKPCELTLINLIPKKMEIKVRRKRSVSQKHWKRQMGENAKKVRKRRTLNSLCCYLLWSPSVVDSQIWHVFYALPFLSIAMYLCACLCVHGLHPRVNQPSKPPTVSQISYIKYRKFVRNRIPITRKKVIEIKRVIVFGRFEGG